MEINTNTLRALSGIILLILGIAIMILKDVPDILNYIVLALAGFLVGGSIGGPKDPPKNA
jgi:hypothetical protein